ncbi:hypothetical protein QBC45DRAFT_318290 [Copromyces sp. CBS 386.78]|nr:hypothetical protein QBC45DRAFT_318290 [Copromyces sp. CBS 386.78]
MCLSVQKTYTICGHNTDQEWVCKAVAKKIFQRQFGFKAPRVNKPITCPRPMKRKSKIEFGFCHRCVERQDALKKARAEEGMVSSSFL